MRSRSSGPSRPGTWLARIRCGLVFWTGTSRGSLTWSPGMWRAAVPLVENHALTHRLRTLDALQLAVAKELAGRGLADHFVAADKVICEVAQVEGLSVIDPERI